MYARTAYRPPVPCVHPGRNFDCTRYRDPLSPPPCRQPSSARSRRQRSSRRRARGRGGKHSQEGPGKGGVIESPLRRKKKGRGLKEAASHGLRSCIARQQATAAGAPPPAPLPASCWRYCTSSPSIGGNMPAPAAPSRAIVGPSRALLRQHKWRGCREGLLIRVSSAIRLDEGSQAAKARPAIRQRRTK